MGTELYIGTELELFADAHNWKAYFASLIRPHLGANVLEVGAGIGGTTTILTRNHVGTWLCLEPDAALACQVTNAITRGDLPPSCHAVTGTLADLPSEERFDSILYIDVLEHIENDLAETAEAARRLRPGGRLIILSPAYEWLYSPFDRAIGHFRRYNRRTLTAAIPKDLTLLKFSYLDSVGLLASAGNRFVTRSSSPSRSQIRLWDGLMVPASRLLDTVVGHSFGKSVFGVWQRSPG
jgi:SAM-dependent methyltransferase